jgi:glycosyltransferase involved in cell wall biosynthesis
MIPGRYTILICTRNRAETLALALASHLSIDVPEGVSRDMVVVDNASTDSTAETVAQFAATSPFTVTYVRENREGHSVALNTGCRAATGDIIVFTDDDAFPDKSWLTAIHDTFARHSADWVYGPVHPVWEGATTPWWYGPYTSALVACLDYGPEEFVATDYERSFAGVNHACRRDRLFELGLYREDYGLLPGRKSFTGNDDDLFRRAVAAGYRVVYQPRVAVNHLIPAARGQARYHREIAVLVAKNIFTHVHENPPAGPLLLGLPRFYFRLTLEHLLGWFRGVVGGNRSLRFYNELRLVRFLLIIRHALRDRVVRAS